MSQPCALSIARDRDGLLGLDAAGHPVHRADAHAHRLVRRPDRPARVEDRQRKAHAIFERAAELVGPLVGERRDERRQQIAVRHVHFEQIEAGAIRALCGGARSRLRPRACRRASSRAGPGCGPGSTAAATRTPAASRRRPAARCRLPTDAASRLFGRRARAECRSSRDSARARSRRSASTRRHARAAYRPAHHGEMRASRDTSVISAMTRPAPPIARLPRCTRCQSPTVPSSATYWHIGDTTTRFGNHELAQAERREHRRRHARADLARLLCLSRRLLARRTRRRVRGTADRGRADPRA